MRKRISEVTCDNCDCLIGHFKFNVTENIIEDGGYVIGRHDFCTENCAKEFIEKRSHHYFNLTGDNHDRWHTAIAERREE